MVLKVFYDLLSQPSRALVIFVRAARIPHEEVEVSLQKMQQHSPSYAKINPMKKVPAMTDDEFSLTESSAILRYISDQHLADDQRHWYPKDLKLRAKINEYLDWHHLNTRANCAGYVRAKFLQPIMTRKKPDPEKLSELLSGMHKTLHGIDSYFLQNRKFMLGEHISIADLQAACEIETVRAMGYDPAQDFPNIGEWMDRIRSETAPIYDDANKRIRRMSKFLSVIARIATIFDFSRKKI